MNSDERRESLAEQAAAWVPPWERAAAPRETDEPADSAPADDVPGDSALGDGVPGDGGADDTPAAAGDGPADAVPAGEPTGLPAGERPGTDVDADPTTGTATRPTQPVETPEPAVPAVRDEPAVPDGPVPAVRDRPAVEDGPPAGEPEATGPGGDTALAAETAEPGPPAQPAAGPEPAVPVPGKKGNRTAARDRRPEPELPALADDAELRAALEAILLVVDQPVADVVLAQVLEQPTARVTATLARISADYTAAGHGFDLRRAAGGWRLYTRPEYAPYVERFVLDGQSVRLTQAALETLAVVAYKQPVTRSRISAIRGVNCDGVLRTLVTRGLVEECGTESETGAFLYRTTVLFLEKLGLDTVDQLPPLAPFLPDDVEEIADAQR
ncbi:SMC-Scp complex subunit ScpB [Polymorphospora rubra]|uniref:SMC-Scp complex subunit ScpB n=1 Tax=Polymorphospora rubra TaxID=338584 RepID=UPI0033F2CAE0